MTVIGNPVPGVFLSLFPEGTPILAEKDPDLLIYASAPNRGLDSLIKYILPELRRSRPALRLEIYSGFYMDRGTAYKNQEGKNAESEQEAWLADAARIPSVAVSRGIPKQQLALRFRRAAMLCYPCIFRETFCSVVREAMAAGCIVSTTRGGALAETTASFAALTPARLTAPNQFVEVDAGVFVRLTLVALEHRDKNPEAWEATLRQQINYVRQNSAPGVIAKAWHDALRAA